MSTFGTVCYTERQTKGKLERERFRPGPPPLHPSHPFHPRYTLRRTLLIQHTLAKWNTFSTKTFLFCNRKIILTSQNFSDRWRVFRISYFVPTCDGPLKSFRLLSSHLTLAEWDTFFSPENFPLSPTFIHGN